MKKCIRLPKDVVDLARDQIKISRQTLSGFISLAIEEKWARVIEEKKPKLHGRRVG